MPRRNAASVMEGKVAMATSTRAVHTKFSTKVRAVKSVDSAEMAAINAEARHRRTTDATGLASTVLPTACEQARAEQPRSYMPPSIVLKRTMLARNVVAPVVELAGRKGRELGMTHMTPHEWFSDRAQTLCRPSKILLTTRR